VNLAPHSQSTDTMQPAEKTSELTEFDLGYYGWRVVLAACLGVMAGFGSLFVYTFSVFVKPLAAEFGWSREAISSGFAIAAVTLGWPSPHHSCLHDDICVRHSLIVAVALRIVAVLRDLLRTGCSWKRCSSSGLFAIDFHLVSATPGNGVGLRDGGSGFGRHDFTRRRSIHHQPVWLASSVRVTRWSCIVTRLASRWRYIRERDVIGHGFAPVAHSGMTWQQDLRSFAFWIITAILFVSSISMNGAITHLSALLTDRGLTAGNAALCASILGGSSLLGRIVVGWLLDRFFGPRVALVINLTTALGILLLARANSFPAGCLAAALIGVGAGGEAAITPYLLTRYFGLRAFSTLYGLTWTFYAAAGAIGPVILGRAFDATGSYSPLLVLLAATLGLVATTNLLLPRYADSFTIEVN
jgi:hypothetical protein